MLARRSSRLQDKAARRAKEGDDADTGSVSDAQSVAHSVPERGSPETTPASTRSRRSTATRTAASSTATTPKRSAITTTKRGGRKPADKSQRSETPVEEVAVEPVAAAPLLPTVPEEQPATPEADPVELHVTTGRKRRQQRRSSSVEEDSPAHVPRTSPLSVSVSPESVPSLHDEREEEEPALQLHHDHEEEPAADQQPLPILPHTTPSHRLSLGVSTVSPDTAFTYSPATVTPFGVTPQTTGASSAVAPQQTTSTAAAHTPGDVSRVLAPELETVPVPPPSAAVQAVVAELTAAAEQRPHRQVVAPEPVTVPQPETADVPPATEPTSATSATALEPASTASVPPVSEGTSATVAAPSAEATSGATVTTPAEPTTATASTTATAAAPAAEQTNTAAVAAKPAVVRAAGAIEINRDHWETAAARIDEFGCGGPDAKVRAMRILYELEKEKKEWLEFEDYLFAHLDDASLDTPVPETEAYLSAAPEDGKGDDVRELILLFRIDTWKRYKPGLEDYRQELISFNLGSGKVVQEVDTTIRSLFKDPKSAPSNGTHAFFLTDLNHDVVMLNKELLKLCRKAGSKDPTPMLVVNDKPLREIPRSPPSHAKSHLLTALVEVQICLWILGLSWLDVPELFWNATIDPLSRLATGTVGKLYGLLFLPVLLWYHLQWHAECCRFCSLRSMFIRYYFSVHREAQNVRVRAVDAVTKKWPLVVHFVAGPLQRRPALSGSVLWAVFTAGLGASTGDAMFAAVLGLVCAAMVVGVSLLPIAISKLTPKPKSAKPAKPAKPDAASDKDKDKDKPAKMLPFGLADKQYLSWAQAADFRRLSLIFQSSSSYRFLSLAWIASTDDEFENWFNTIRTACDESVQAKGPDMLLTSVSSGKKHRVLSKLFMDSAGGVSQWYEPSIIHPKGTKASPPFSKSLDDVVEAAGYLLILFIAAGMFGGTPWLQVGKEFLSSFAFSTVLCALYSVYEDVWDDMKKAAKKMAIASLMFVPLRVLNGVKSALASSVFKRLVKWIRLAALAGACFAVCWTIVFWLRL